MNLRKKWIFSCRAWQYPAGPHCPVELQTASRRKANCLIKFVPAAWAKRKEHGSSGHGKHIAKIGAQAHH